MTRVNKKTMALLLLLLAAALAVFTLHRPLATANPVATDTLLGRYLFFDTRLSFNNTKSCASCHDPKFAFTDGYRRSITATGENVLHNAPSLINIALHRYFDWANPTVTTLAQQHKRPLFGTDPIELGTNQNMAQTIARLQTDTLYQRLFAAAFPGQPNPYTPDNMVIALTAFVHSLQSARSPFDRFSAGDSLALGTDARKGWQLFSGNRLRCTYCHGGPHFTNATLTANIDSVYHNTGLYNIGNRYPGHDNGLRRITQKISDDGRFKTPSLRNITLTAPYMHDGSVATLSEVMDHYARRGRLVTLGPWAGDGAKNPNKSAHLRGFSLSAEEKKQLLAFLASLTDSTVLDNPAFQNPFSQSNN
jgi:cytochrome c peroxidase